MRFGDDERERVMEQNENGDGGAQRGGAGLSQETHAFSI